MIAEPVLLAVSDCRIFRREFHADLRVGVARTVPSGERVGANRLLPLELEQPAAGVRLARLGGLAVELGNARDRHRMSRCRSGGWDERRFRLSVGAAVYRARPRDCRDPAGLWRLAGVPIEGEALCA